ncbi:MULTISPECIES: DUF488 domain-containing protein [unclassified Simplicispira]|uniref:DUF488 domain-containing protein n=1 Tax=unclassified Simplicispira TaxID=2630407 RepID=UPI000D5D7838|nr:MULTISPECIES: DUF488 family protein [unclassified Simplicispira]PVY55769.1 uncharacterized protein YeaO (DUF488 family) [Simplicispira sp. 125]REG16712.1 uncharacterized protein YeaO (DUF488 family) [Simplicispira sp. 110]
MPLRIVRLGTPRAAGEGTRIGTVRRPPRGVPKAEFASRDYYDVWYPLLSPSAELMAQGQQAQTDKEWEQFIKQFRKELAQPEASRTLDLLAALSHHSAMSVGCYCEEEARCHRSVLRAELLARGADVAP